MRVLCFLLLSLTCSPSIDSETRINGTVVDSEGAVISKAFVLIHWDASGSTVGLKSNVGIDADLTTQTDEFGRFGFKVPPGFYDVFVSAIAFTPSCKKIRTHAGETVRPQFRLEASPIVIKEIGTTYSN